MTDYYLRVPAWTDKAGNTRGGYTCRVCLAAVLRAGKTPHPKLVEKFYGADAPREVFGPKRVDRFVFRKDSGDYIIVPDVARNRNMVWPA